MHRTEECLPDELVFELVRGSVADAELPAVQQHLASCEDCRVLVAEAAAGDPLDPAVATVPLREEPAPSLKKGDRVGRYEVEELIGSGGIGLVYAARDPELHRRVALKLMRSTSMMFGAVTDVGQRMLREARAMAQLSHPNVVTVYDVGTYEGRVFLAMELVSGSTLRRWLASQPRTLAEIVGAFRAAGDGLSAAHRIRLVHRDFKPENVLVGDDGRVRVTDFGLARPVDWEGTGSHKAFDGKWATATVTRTGVIAGTPAYMAPEQYAGEAPDPRSDQFGFCVGLYEALFGERPFEGTTMDELSVAITTGTVKPPTKREVPPALRALVLRGLSKDPSERFPSMAALLEELAIALDPPTALQIEAPRKKRTGLVTALAAAVVAAGVIVGVALRVDTRSAGAQVDPPAISAAGSASASATGSASGSAAAAGSASATGSASASATGSAPAPAAVTASAPAAVTAAAPAPVPVTAPKPAPAIVHHAPPPTKPAPPPPPQPVRVGNGLKDPFQ